MNRPTMLAGQMDVLEKVHRDGRTYALARKCEARGDELLTYWLVITHLDGAGKARVAPWLSEAPARDYFKALTTPTVTA
jgi:hypothetical protein